ncbi:MAG: hypothetical protein AB3N16_13070 [Flavobacteriaceae bacterium]
MELDRIEHLLENYFEGTTTVAEEQKLHDYFSQEGIAPHLAQYAPMFQYFSQAKEERLGKLPTLTDPQRPKMKLYRWVAVAAGVIMAIGLYFNRVQQNTLHDEYTAEELASAQQALALLANNFNKGAQQIHHLGEFEKEANRFLIKDKQE